MTEVSAFGVFNTAGRLAGCFVYMLFCHDGGPIYVKIGLSEVPDKRLTALRTTCAVSPRVFSTVEVRTRRIALKLERALHTAFAPYRTMGEWFVFPENFGHDFKTRRREVLQPFDVDPTRPLRWTNLNVEALAELARRRRIAWFRKHCRKRPGPALQDFQLHLKQEHRA